MQTVTHEANYISRFIHSQAIEVKDIWGYISPVYGEKYPLKCKATWKRKSNVSAPG